MSFSMAKVYIVRVQIYHIYIIMGATSISIQNLAQEKHVQCVICVINYMLW